jgi:serine/threonine protein kinase
MECAYLSAHAMNGDEPTLTGLGSAPPERAGKYRIVGRIGQGGMGVVSRALDEDLGRTVALKFIPPEFGADAQATQRFVREARAASALDHPNIGTIFGVEETEDHRRFIVMAFYEGRSLDHRIADPVHLLAPDEAL